MPCTNKDFLLTECNSSSGGVDKFVMEYDLDDWLLMERSNLITRDADGTITGIVNAVGVRAYKREVPSASIITPTSTPQQVAGGFPVERLAFNYTLIATDQEAKNVSKRAMYKDRVCIIYKNTGEGEVWGDQQGVILVGGAYDPSNIEVGNQIPLELATDEAKAGETCKPPSIVDAAGSQATLDLILGLTVVGTP